MRLHPIALAATVVLSAGLASAQDRANRFEQRDANGDGVLSHDEYTSTGGHPGNFRALDVNGDGVLSRGEFVGRNGAVEAPAYEDQGYDDQVYDDRVYDDRGMVKTGSQGGGMVKTNPGVYGNGGYRKGGSASSSSALEGFRYKDRDRDGRLSREEYAEQRTFNRVDRNRDGWISSNEFLNPPPAPGPGSTEYEFLARDRNRDGMLSRDEVRDGRAFSRADGNGDGRVSYDEFASSQVARRVRY
jgi:Ca2+-binding EF-hand superfamily protein